MLVETSFIDISKWLIKIRRYLLISIAMAGSTSYAVETVKPSIPAAKNSPWVIVQPRWAPGFMIDTAEEISKGLERELGYEVPIDAATRGLGEKAMQWSLDVAPTQANIVVVPEESILIFPEKEHLASHLKNFEPLLVLAYKRWCAYTLQSSSLTSAAQLADWLSKSSAPVRVAVPSMTGRISLWVKGMAQQTRREWQPQEYGVNGDFVKSLTEGADIAIARCDRIGASKSNIRLLVHSGGPKNIFYKDIPKFGELGWLPFSSGWVGVLAPNVINVEDRERLAQAIYKVMQKDAVKNRMIAAGFIPANLPPLDSRQFISSFYQSWALIDKLLNRYRQDENQQIKR